MIEYVGYVIGGNLNDPNFKGYESKQEAMEEFIDQLAAIATKYEDKSFYWRRVPKYVLNKDFSSDKIFHTYTARITVAMDNQNDNH